MTLWNELGFRESPYGTDPIPGTSEGERLLIGRDRELRRLRNYLTSSTVHPTVEGSNGVGKTSLVSVAAYQLKRKFELGHIAQPWIALPNTFQLSPNDTVDSLTQKLAYQVANGFIEHRDLLQQGSFNVPDVHDVNQWINSPIIRGTSGGASAAGFGANYGRTSIPNTGQGFSEAGFAAAMDRWLRSCFPTREAGGFIAVIDNLELLQTSQAARALLESLRDTILDQPGVKWVLCGARGIVRTGASSPRLEGRLSEPLDLQPVGREKIPDVIDRRIDEFRAADTAIAPVGPSGFTHLYDVLNENLRNAFKFAEDFTFWLYEEREGDLGSEEERDELLQTWLTEQADRYNSETSLGSRAWDIFDLLAQDGGSMSPSEYERFDFNSYNALRPHMKALEDAQLVQSEVDESDRRRKTIAITPRGWLVHYARNGHQAPSGISD